MSATIEEILDEIAGKMAALSGVTAYAWDADRISSTPAVMVGLPERTQYRLSYSPKGKKFTVTLVVLVGKASARGAHKKLLPFIENTGDRSVFRTVDSAFTTYEHCDDVTVVDSESDIWINNAVQFLGAEFTIDVTATGA